MAFFFFYFFIKISIFEVTKSTIVTLKGNDKQNNMKNTIVIVTILLMSSMIFGQNEFEPGIIHLKNGQEKKGLIQFLNETNTNKVFYKESVDSELTQFTPNQINSYKLDNVNKKVISEKLGLKAIFMEVIIEGKANLLLYKDENRDNRYFLKSEKSGLKELDIITRNEGDLQKGQFQLKRYVGILNFEFNDCTEMNGKTNQIRLTLSSLSKAFTTYNNCVSEVSFTSERLNRTDYHTIFIEAGINFTSIREKGDRVRGKDFENSFSPTVGLTYVYTPTIFNSRTSLSAGISYNSVNSETAYFRNNDVLIGNYRTTKINPKTINIKLGIHYNLNKSKRKLNPSLGIFYINSRLLNKDSAYLRIDNEGVEEYLYEDFEIPISSASSGFAIEFSTSYAVTSKNNILIKLGYERIGDFLDYFGASYATNTFYVKTGYSFDL